MFHVMSDPVRLPDSGKIVDRSTIARHFLSDQNDPFTKAPLTMEQVEPLDDLKMAIQAWKEEKRHQANWKFLAFLWRGELNSSEMFKVNSNFMYAHNLEITFAE